MSPTVGLLRSKPQTLSPTLSDLKGSFEVDWQTVEAGHLDTLGAQYASVVTGRLLGAPSDATGGDLEVGVAVVKIPTGVGPSVGADGIHVVMAAMNEGVGGLAGVGGHSSSLHHEVAIAPGIPLGVGLREIDVLPLELLVTAFPLGGRWQGAQQDQQQ